MNQIRRAAQIHLSRRSFWHYCQTIAPDFYLDEYWHLHEICETLQALYEGRIQKEKAEDEWQIVVVKNPEWITCKKLMLNVPPQHGKTRTLVNFSSWIFGINSQEKIICGSYNDATASDFSRYTRDAICAVSHDEGSIMYSDIFPQTKIKKGNAGFEKWALEGAHFSYLGAGVGGSITSKGGSILIIDDPIKGAEEALNENVLDRTWLWYTSTFLSRVAAQYGEPIEIVNMTRWAEKDPCGRILESKAKADWYVLKFKAYYAETDSMLCPKLFSRKRFEEQRLLVYAPIFNANYLQETVEQTGVLFRREEMQYFYRKDLTANGRESILGYADIADQGDDKLAMAIGHVFTRRVFLADVLFTDAETDVTPAMVAEKINMQRIDITRMEGNNQGRVFARLVRQLVEFEKINVITNSTNKLTRIKLMYGIIVKYFVFLHPSEYEVGSEYDLFMKQVFSYMRDGSSKHDDAPDALAGLAKFVIVMFEHLFLPEEAQAQIPAKAEENPNQ